MLLRKSTSKLGGCIEAHITSDFGIDFLLLHLGGSGEIVVLSELPAQKN